MTVRKSPQEPSKRETIAERTSAAATEIIGKETSQRLQKTARLRAARLSQEQAGLSRTSKTAWRGPRHLSPTV